MVLTNQADQPRQLQPGMRPAVGGGRTGGTARRPAALLHRATAHAAGRSSLLLRSWVLRTGRRQPVVLARARTWPTLMRCLRCCLRSAHVDRHRSTWTGSSRELVRARDATRAGRGSRSTPRADPHGRVVLRQRAASVDRTPIRTPCGSVLVAMAMVLVVDARLHLPGPRRGVVARPLPFPAAPWRLGVQPRGRRPTVGHAARRPAAMAPSCLVLETIACFAIAASETGPPSPAWSTSASCGAR
jgi:hypothetical protein